MPLARSFEPVRSLVKESWERSLAGQLDPERLAAPLWADSADLATYREAHPLAAVMPVIRKLLVRDADFESGILVAIGDAGGRLLWVEGDQSLKRRAESMMFVEGADWSEGVAGTSAPGTALTLDRSVQIRRDEHFNVLVHDWSCTAVPVHDPESRALLGVIDITGGDEAVGRHTMPLVEATAMAVENEILLRRLAERRDPPKRLRVVGFAPKARPRRPAVLSVLGRDGGLLATESVSVRLSRRHSEILTLLVNQPSGLSAESLSLELYGNENTVTLRAEMARLKRVLEKSVPELVPESRPYRLTSALETDACQIRLLLQRGAHRAAVAAYLGDVLPGSTAPGIEAIRDELRAALRERVLSDSSLDVLLAYLESDLGHDDLEAWQLALKLLPARSPRRALAVARIEALQAEA